MISGDVDKDEAEDGHGGHGEDAIQMMLVVVGSSAGTCSRFQGSINRRCWRSIIGIFSASQAQEVMGTSVAGLPTSSTTFQYPEVLFPLTEVYFQ